MNNYFTNNPAYKNLWGLKESDFKYLIEKSEKEIWGFLNKDLEILEIGFWAWGFTEVCRNKWIKNYTWIDIDWFFLNDLQKKYPKYKFNIISFWDFLKDKKEKYDLVYMSHVFEHLNEEERESCIKLIYQSLKKWGIWINYMPNCESIIEASKHRYFDLTHKTSYCPNSFEQLLNENIKNYKITHLNSHVWTWIFFKRLVYLFFLNLTKIYWKWMWRSFPKINTWEFISIIQKNGK